MTTSTISLIAGGATFYFGSGVRTPWDGVTSTPWAAANTTPFRIGLDWTPTAATPDRSFGPAAIGGGSLTAIASEYPDSVTDTVTVHVYGTTPYARLTALQRLKRALNAGQTYYLPTRLVLEPNDTSAGLTPVVFDVYGGDIQEDARTTLGDLSQHSSTDGRRVLFATMTLIRSAFGGRAQSEGGETLFSNTTFTNAPGSNTHTMAPAKGDRIFDGQPLNLTIVPQGSATAARVYLASIAFSFTRDDAGTDVSLSSSYASLGSMHFTISDLYAQYPVTPRLFVTVTNITDSCVLRVNLSISNGPVYHTIDLSGAGLGSAAQPRLVDCGDIPLPLIPGDGLDGGSLYIEVEALGTGTAQLATVEVIGYYEYAVIAGLDLSPTIGDTPGVSLSVASYPAASPDRALLPFATPHAVMSVANGGSTDSVMRVPAYGTLPLCRSSALLWLYATPGDEWGALLDTSAQFAVTATQAPLYYTLRGGD